ncbi:MAG: AMP-dependent synthetase [Candidatus Cloacimonetes bacterium 4572_55]|nr:MAG: AMP-dependent synthetase [Candidatus Cloacimonetes bacterium 4572_55]
MFKNDEYPFGQEIAWRPNSKWIAESNLQRFMNKHGITKYDTLYQRSIKDAGWFWTEILNELKIKFYQPYSQVLDLSGGIQFPRWCVDGKMNIIHNMLDKWQGTDVQNRAALRWESEEGDTRILTYVDLNREVCRCANALRYIGLGKGDAVALYLPMIPESVISFLAIIKIGGIVLPIFTGYNHSAIATRLADAGAKAVITTDRVIYRGKTLPMKRNIDDALKVVPSVEHVIVVNRAGARGLHWKVGRDYWWSELVSSQSMKAETERTEAEDTLLIMHTAGTDGRPKGAVHTHCGFPIKAALDMYHPMDLKPQDTVFWITDMGGMMGPWQVFGAMLIGATITLYDGAFDFPTVDRLWMLVESHNITHLGVSPTLTKELKKHGKEPVQRHNLSSLRMIGSTGNPWDLESWNWLFETVLNREKPIFNYSGGMEIGGGIVGGNFFKPLKPGAFSGPVVGMNSDVVVEGGRPIRGAVGELVIRGPWIGMTRSFWKDRQSYLDTHWSKFKNCWRNGDLTAIDEDGLWYILGRSDDTIKVDGNPIGPAETEAVLNNHEWIEESVAIGVPHPMKTEEVMVFCVPTPNAEQDDSLRDVLKKRLVDQLGKLFEPREIKFVTALPKTRNGKVMRSLIKAVYLGENPGDIGNLENIATMDAIRQAK